MNEFTESEVITIVTTIINFKKEESILGYSTDEEYIFPKNIMNKLDSLTTDKYINFLSTMDEIAINLYGKFEEELNFLNKLHEEILIKYREYV